MLPRVLLILITLFWVLMNVLLWRFEYGAHPPPVNLLPAPVLWQKILTAPDSSSLTVFHKGKKVGFCHWITSVSQELDQVSPEQQPPEGMLGRATNYRLQLEGNIGLDAPEERLRFDGHLTLNSKQVWQEFSVRLNLRPAVWEIQANAANQSLHLIGQDERGKFDRVYTFSELQNPENLLRDVAGPYAASFIGTAISALGPVLPGDSNNPARKTAPPNALTVLGRAVKWEARHDSVRIGHSSVPAYRLRAQLLNRYEAVLFISRVGEILKAELPDGFVLVNDQMAGF